MQIPTLGMWLGLTTLGVLAWIAAGWAGQRLPKAPRSAASPADASMPAPGEPLPPPQALSAMRAVAPYDSMERYFSTQRALFGRWKELEELRKKAIGVRVRWCGRVAYVVSFTDGTVGMHLWCTDEREVIGVRFSPAFKERAFALPKGKLVGVTGTLTGSPASISIIGESLQALLDRPSTPERPRGIKRGPGPRALH